MKLIQVGIKRSPDKRPSARWDCCGYSHLHTNWCWESSITSNCNILGKVRMELTIDSRPFLTAIKGLRSAIVEVLT